MSDRPSATRALRLLLRLIGPVIFLGLLLFVVDIDQIVRALKGVDAVSLLGCMLLLEAIVLLRTGRWKLIHDTLGLQPRPLFYHLRLTFAAGIAVLVLPQVTSPFSRVVLLIQDGEKGMAALGGAALEKIFEAAVYLVFGILGAFYFAALFPGARMLLVTGMTIGVIVALSLWFGRRRFDGLRRAVERRFGARFTAILASARSRVTWRRIVAIVVISLAIGLAQATVTFALSRALGVRLPFDYMLASWGLVALTLLVPISVNGLGTREAVYVATFAAAGASEDAAFALGLLVVATAFVAFAPGVLEWVARFARPRRATGPEAGSVLPGSPRRNGEA